MDDLISRQAAIDALWKALYEYEDKTEKQFQESEDLDVGDWIEHRIFVQNMNDIDRQTILNLPSAQPEKEKAERVLWTGWKGCRDTRYKCPNCKKPVKNDDIYCHRCGQRLMFPHISFTDYVPGEKQETIVRWDDE